MKKAVLLSCMAAAVALTATPYDVTYTYDAAGNRIMREPKTEVINKAMRSLPDQVTTQSMFGEIQVRFSPNPTDGPLRVTVNTDNENVGVIQIYSTSGMLLQQISGKSQADFDLSGQQAGIYLLLVDINGENQVYKIIKK